MNVRDEINRHAAESDREVLLFLLDRYHMASQWNFIASCTWDKSTPHFHRVWKPTQEGFILYYFFKEAQA